MQEIDDDTVEQSEVEPSPTTEQTFHTAPNTPEHATTKSELMHISIHATTGTASTATFSLLVNIGGYQAVALVDSGSSHTFMDYGFAIKSNFTLKPVPTKKIAIASGGHLLAQFAVTALIYQVQGHDFTNAFHIIPLQTYDIILGIDWMYTVSPVTLDLPPRLLIVTNKGRQIVLTDHTNVPLEDLLQHKGVQQLMCKSILGYIIQVHALESLTTVPTHHFTPQ
jgi:hypothetical protein